MLAVTREMEFASKGWPPLVLRWPISLHGPTTGIARGWEIHLIWAATGERSVMGCRWGTRTADAYVQMKADRLAVLVDAGAGAQRSYVGLPGLHPDR